jgi:hypothetical protein
MPVTIPEKARVILDPEGDKYRADKLFFHPRKDKNFYIEKLFDNKTFPIENYRYLVEYYSDKFDIWFDKEIFPEYQYTYLAIYCSDKFDVWFDKETFPIESYRYLTKYCSDKKHIWDR